MSSDHLLRSLEQSARTIQPLRQLPPLFAATALLERPGGSLSGLMDGLLHFVGGSQVPVEYVVLPSVTVTDRGPPRCGTIYAPAGTPKTDAAQAKEEFGLLAGRMDRICCDLPAGASGRLGFDWTRGSPVWVNRLFHLAWHFPHYLGRGEVRRSRLVRSGAGGPVHEIDESRVQLHGCDMADVYPGVVFSKFPRHLDLATATGWAIDLMSAAVRAGAGGTPGTRARFDDLRGRATRYGRDLSSASVSGMATGPDAVVVAVGTDPADPPAAEVIGAAGEGGRAVYVLSSRDAAREYCVLRGRWVDPFVKFADEAGGRLPTWPATPHPDLLGDAADWCHTVAEVERIVRELEGVTPPPPPPSSDGPDPPAAARRRWGRRGGVGDMVTDHRGNVERWLGFVFSTLKEHDPGSVEIRFVPDGGGRDGRGIPLMSLRGINLFTASALAMELAASALDETPAPGSSSARETPVWNPTARRLTYRGLECKSFRRAAPDQERILASFQEEGWPEAIDDPLTGGKLAKTVESLNHRLQHLRFGRNGAGTGILWWDARSRVDDG